jgi:hypothetical protein
MNNFPDFTYLPEYKALRDQHPSVINQDFVPQIIDNVLTKNQINRLYDLIDNYPFEKIRVQKWGGQGCYDGLVIPIDIQEKILGEANKVSDEPVEIAHMSLVRYSPSYGYEVKLFPHYDTRPSEMFVFDLQLKTNEEWGVIVEGKKFNLIDNQALFFSGTQQLHWRENKKISPNAQIDMLFVWLTHKNKRFLNEDHNQIMKSRENLLLSETKISNLEQPYSYTNNNTLTQNIIYKEVFTEKEMNELYSVINLDQIERTTIVPIYAQKAWFVDLPEAIKNKVKDIAEQIYNLDLELEEISFARYSKEYGNLPNLTPHFDNTFLEQRLTIDVQLKSNINWAIIVEDNSFTLKNNEALTFSGTHQIHWREYKKFNPDDYIEMLFCHFSLKNKKRITIEEKVQIEGKMSLYSNTFATSLMKKIQSHE